MLTSNYTNRNFCNEYIKQHINNKKGTKFNERFIDVISDPNNLLIKRVKNAGEIIDDENVVLHNGIIVSKNGYYDNFSEILIINKGCHEPGEERMFAEVLQHIPENGVMIELGSYWAFYTIWFNKMIKNAKNYCIEPEIENMKIGMNNCELNNVSADFKQGFIGNKPNEIKISQYVQEKNIDYIHILHSDIQGNEFELLQDIKPLLLNKKIKYLFISTHSNCLHHSCTKLLQSCNYRIIATADFDNETFCFDGIIVACHKDNVEIPFTHLGNRQKTILRDKHFDFEYY